MPQAWGFNRALSIVCCRAQTAVVAVSADSIYLYHREDGGGGGGGVSLVYLGDLQNLPRKNGERKTRNVSLSPRQKA